MTNSECAAVSETMRPGLETAMSDACVLLQLTPAQRGVMEHFQKGGAVSTVLLIVFIAAAAIVVTYLLTRVRESLARSRDVHDPARLYRDLVAALPLEEDDRVLLRSMVTGFSDPNPAVILISPKAFDRAVRSAARRTGRANAGASDERVARVRGVLFPLPARNDTVLTRAPR